MSESFRLLSAAGGFERRNLIDSVDQPLSYLDVEFASKAAIASHQPWISVVIGKNGVGKSRLLAGIADILETLDRGSIRKRTDKISVSRLSYLIDGQFCEIEIDDHDYPRARINGSYCELVDLPVPTKIIALTTTPFDKFRISRTLLRMPEKDGPDEPERYTYLGLRDRTGRASPTAAIFRAIEGLFDASRSGADRRFRIAEVFGFLGYRPGIDVRYEISPQNAGRLRKIIEGQSVEDVLGSEDPNVFMRPLARMLMREPALLDEMRSIGKEVLVRADGGRHFTLRADFEDMSADDVFFRRIQLLRRADLLRMRAAVVERVVDGTALDLKLASSGELGIVTGFLGLASVIEDGSLIFIDEPEISLHPEWQTRYIDLLMRTFGKFSGCHFVLATHSPLILSDIKPENSNVVFLDPDRREPENTEEFSGQSSDHLLITAFQVAGKNNLYLKQEVIKALRLAANGETNSGEFATVMAGMASLLPNLEEDTPVANLIRELQAVADVRLSP